MSPEFRRRLLKDYKESRWARVLEITRQNEALGKNAVKMLYKIIDNLLFFDDDERGFRLCILTVIEAEVFKLVYDEMRHPDYIRIYEKLTEGLYIFNITTKLHKFIRYCPYCQLNQTSRHRPYSFLQSILTSAIPFHTLTIDFILFYLSSCSQTSTTAFYP